MEDAARLEILSLHRFLENWMKGALEPSRTEFARLDRALAEDFVVIHPSGATGDKRGVLESFACAYGTKDAGYGLEIGDVDVRAIARDLAVAVYTERHRGEPGRARISTALLRRRPADDSLEWLHLHETLLDVA